MNWLVMVVQGPHRGKVFTLKHDAPLVVGRDQTLQLCLADEQAMTQPQLRFTTEPGPQGGCVVTDLGSPIATQVNGRAIAPDLPTPLQADDLIRVADTVFQVKLASEAAVEATWPREAPDTVAAQPDLSPPETQPMDAKTVPGNESTPTPRSGSSESDQAVPSQFDISPEHPVRPAPRLRDDSRLPFGVVMPPGYQYLDKIGKGGMGQVYKVERIQDGQIFAMKSIIPERMDREDSLQMFQREMNILSQLEHPRIVRYIHMGEYAGTLYFVMEYIKTTDFEKKLQEWPEEIRLAAICGVTRQVLDALAFCHEKGFVHRDIKPGNILINTEERKKLRVYLADFGLARNYLTSKLSGTTKTGDMRGTLGYAAPEAMENPRLAKEPCDIYSVGATLHKYLTGERPRLPMGLQKASRLEELRPDLPEDLYEIVDRAMAFHPADRYATAREMFDALEPFARPPGR